MTVAILSFFLRLGSTILHKKFQAISSKNEGVTPISANYLSKFKVQGMDIATLLGAKGPSRAHRATEGLKGPQPSTGAGRKGT